MRSFTDRRNLLLCKRKNHHGRWFFRRLVNPGRFSNRGNWLKWSADTKYCPFSVASVRPPLQDSRYLNPLILSYQWLLPVAFCRVFSGWTQDDSYRIRRSSRAERGVLAHSPAWSELSGVSLDIENYCTLRLIFDLPVISKITGPDRYHRWCDCASAP